MRRLVFPLLFLLCACGKLKELPTEPGLGSEPIDPTATFTRVQNEIFTPTCGAIGCHDTLGHQEGQILTAGKAYANTVGVPSTQMPSLLRVAPNDPANSYLYRKIAGACCTTMYFAASSTSSMAFERSSESWRSGRTVHDPPIATSALLSSPHSECTRSLRFP